jgi:hypothetical protein
MEKTKLSNVALAAAAASMFLAGCASSGGSGSMKMADAGGVSVKCYGANACKGQAECKTAMNECKGHNACKAQGFMTLTEKACLERLGRA